MPDPQGLISFPGIKGIIRANVTLGTGIRPSAIVITLVPQRRITILEGTLRFTYKGTVIAFRHARIDKASIQVNQGGYVVSLTIEDRRWRWADGWISKFYNIRERGTGNIITSSRATPQEIAKDLLTEMGESRYSVGALPNDIRPQLKLKAHNPAKALQKLATEAGCRIVYDPIKDSILILPKGANSAVPTGGVVQEGAGVDIKPAPSSIDIVLNETEYEFRWSTRAVGEDTDGTIKEINDLSYKPANGWEKEAPKGLYNVRHEHGKAAHSLAQKSVFKWYELWYAIKKPSPHTTTVWSAPTNDEKLSYRDDKGKTHELDEPDFEFFDTLIGTDATTGRRRPMLVYGTYWDGSFSFKNVGTMVEIDSNVALDRKRAILKFSQPLVYLEKVAGSYNNRPALIYPQLMSKWAPNYPQPPLRHVHRTNLGGPGLPHVVRADELKLQVVATYNSSGDFLGVATNDQTLTRETRKIFLSNVEAFQSVNSRNIRYAGLRKVSPSGSVLQVGWQVGPDGAFTTISINSAWDLVLDIDEEVAANSTKELDAETAEIELDALKAELEAEKSKKNKA